MKQQSKKDFEKKFYKLMNNALFGETLGNEGKHKIVKKFAKSFPHTEIF